jgi:nucleoside-diphosphate-sugar epimerase
MSARHLVTGAAGVIGFEVTRSLLARGDEVVAVDLGLKGGLEDLSRLAEEHRGKLRVIQGDLADGGAVARLADLGRFESIFHLAAIVGVRYVCEHPYETVAVNMRTTLNVLDHAIATKPKAVLFASSSENYAASVEAGRAPVPTPESVELGVADPALPRWSYAASKIAGETAVFGAAPLGGFAPVVLRFHNVYGPRMGPTHVIPEFLERARAGTDPFPVYGPEQTRSFLYAEDAARAVLLVEEAAKWGDSGLYNIGGAKETRIEDLAKVVFDVTGFRPKIEAKPAPVGSVGRRAPDVAKITALGFEPTTKLEDGIRVCWTTAR